ncbi:hypothetical protein H8356DRAFT_1363954 [Neocallimastix lanati (nom. inval.)]|nr:hypothetical protein H8356DRAFT_1363954 [Neocallimastix sp. JGI-2020a]
MCAESMKLLYMDWSASRIRIPDESNRDLTRICEQPQYLDTTPSYSIDYLLVLFYHAYCPIDFLPLVIKISTNGPSPSKNKEKISWNFNSSFIASKSKSKNKSKAFLMETDSEGLVHSIIFLLLSSSFFSSITLRQPAFSPPPPPPPPPPPHKKNRLKLILKDGLRDLNHYEDLVTEKNEFYVSYGTLFPYINVLMKIHYFKVFFRGLMNNDRNHFCIKKDVRQGWVVSPLPFLLPGILSLGDKRCCCGGLFFADDNCVMLEWLEIMKIRFGISQNGSLEVLFDIYVSSALGYKTKTKKKRIGKDDTSDGRDFSFKWE